MVAARFVEIMNSGCRGGDEISSVASCSCLGYSGNIVVVERSGIFDRSVRWCFLSFIR